MERGLYMGAVLNIPLCRPSMLICSNQTLMIPKLLFWNVSINAVITFKLLLQLPQKLQSFIALGVAHQALEEINPAGDDILIQGPAITCRILLQYRSLA